MQRPLETSKSDAKQAVVLVQNDRSCLGPRETCYSVPEVAVLHGKTTGGARWGLGPTETCNSGSKVAVFHAQNHR